MADCLLFLERGLLEYICGPLQSDIPAYHTLPPAIHSVSVACSGLRRLICDLRQRAIHDAPSVFAAEGCELARLSVEFCYWRLQQGTASGLEIPIAIAAAEYAARRIVLARFAAERVRNLCEELRASGMTTQTHDRALMDSLTEVEDIVWLGLDAVCDTVSCLLRDLPPEAELVDPNDGRWDEEDDINIDVFFEATRHMQIAQREVEAGLKIAGASSPSALVHKASLMLQKWRPSADDIAHAAIAVDLGPPGSADLKTTVLHSLDACRYCFQHCSEYEIWIYKDREGGTAAKYRDQHYSADLIGLTLQDVGGSDDHEFPLGSDTLDLIPAVLGKWHDQMHVRPATLLEATHSLRQIVPTMLEQLEVL